MKEDDKLTSVEQRVVPFYEDELIAVRASDSHVYVALRQMCDALGIDAQGQTRRINRHTVLAEGLRSVDKLPTAGGAQSGYVLRVDLVPLWLSGIRTKAVSEAVRPKLERFQREAAKVLWEAFQEGRLTTEPGFEALLAQETEAVQAYKMAVAITKLARNQVLFEARLLNHEKDLADFGQRIEQLESQLGQPNRYVTPDQASQISQAVKAVAIALGKRSGRNEFGACYGELYRKFGITSYKMLPANKFEDAMRFLTDWYQNLTDHSVPF